MNPASPRFAEALQLEQFKLITSKNYASTVKDHRVGLRELAINQLSQNIKLSPEKHTTLRDLKLRPRIDGWALSISHCAALGGLASARGDFGLGFDVEESSRVSGAAAQRVAHFPGEKPIAESVSPVSFWVAKESSIKAFSNVSRIDLNFGVVEITAMQPDGSFTARWLTREARGLALSDGELTLAVARTF